MPKKIFSERIELIEKSREAALAAVQIFNNPLATFKSESFIVLFMISWTYLLHAYYREKGIDYCYFKKTKLRKKYDTNPDGSKKYWDLSQCLSDSECPLDSGTVNNLKFLIGLRNQIEHKKADHLDSYLSARYQACALNYNYFLKKLHGDKYGLDNMLALSLQFAELDFEQSKILKDKEDLIPKEIKAYIGDFDNDLSEEERKDERFAYRLLFAKVSAKREGQADRVVEFLDTSYPLAATIKKEYWVKEDREKPKYLPSQIVSDMKAMGYPKFSMSKHTDLWKKEKAKELSKGYGVSIANAWYWYESWRNFVIDYLKNNYK